MNGEGKGNSTRELLMMSYRKMMTFGGKEGRTCRKRKRKSKTFWRSRNIKSLCLRKFGRGNQCGKKTTNVGMKTMWEYWREKG